MTAVDSVGDQVADIAERTRAFVREVCHPGRGALHRPRSGRWAACRVAVWRRATAGVFAPHVPAEFGGLGLDIRGWSVVFEEAGYSLLGPQALNCAAPDEGNMHLLEVVATDEQKERYLRPLAAGEVRSCFAMTEPHPGAGSDPAALSTRARRVDGGWVIDGSQAVHLGRRGRRVLDLHGARAGRGRHDVPHRRRQPRLERGSRMATTDTVFAGGHSEVALRRLPGRSGCRARRGRAGLSLRAGAARAGAPDALHALARPGPAGARHRARPRGRARGVRRPA